MKLEMKINRDNVDNANKKQGSYVVETDNICNAINVTHAIGRAILLL